MTDSDSSFKPLRLLGRATEMNYRKITAARFIKVSRQLVAREVAV